GPSRLRAAGITTNRFTRAVTGLHVESPYAARIPIAVQNDVAKRLQRCRVGEFAFAGAIPKNTFAVTSAEAGCMGKRVDRTDALPLVRAVTFDAQPGTEAVGMLATILLDCVSIARIIATVSGVPLTTNERLCVDAQVRTSDS